MTDLNPFTEPGPDETAYGALTRFQRFLGSYQSNTEDDDQWKSDYELEIGPPTDAATFAEIEAFHQAKGFRVPAGLKSFYLEHGPFRIGATDNFSGALVFSLAGEPAQSWRTHFQSLMLAEHLMFHLGNQLSDEQKRHIEHNFLMFGAHFINDNVHEYWFFDRSGQGIGTLHIDQDYTTIEEIESLFVEPAEVCGLSFDSVIKTCVSDLIDEIQSEHGSSNGFSG